MILDPYRPIFKKDEGVLVITPGVNVNSNQGRYIELTWLVFVGQEDESAPDPHYHVRTSIEANLEEMAAEGAKYSIQDGHFSCAVSGIQRTGIAEGIHFVRVRVALSYSFEQISPCRAGLEDTRFLNDRECRALGLPTYGEPKVEPSVHRPTRFERDPVI